MSNICFVHNLSIEKVKFSTFMQAEAEDDFFGSSSNGVLMDFSAENVKKADFKEVNPLFS